jgi:hypothetical protein
MFYLSVDDPQVCGCVKNGTPDPACRNHKWCDRCRRAIRRWYIDEGLHARHCAAAVTLHHEPLAA